MFDWLKKIFSKKETGLVPEKYFVVHFDELGVTCINPKGAKSSITWNKLKAVHIETNDSGPWFCDVWWLLEGNDYFTAIPQGATGEAELIVRLQQLPNFDNEAMIEAMSCTLNRRFTCWIRN